MTEWKVIKSRKERIKKIARGNIADIINEDKIKNKKESEDTINRNKVLQILADDIANGIAKEKAIENIMQNPIIKKLGYIDNLPNVLKGWIETSYFKKILGDKKIEIRTAKMQTQEESENIENNIDEDER